MCSIQQVTDYLQYPVLMSMLGNVGMLMAFTFVGPLNFIPIEPSVPLITGCLSLIGLSYGSMVVSTFSRAQMAATRYGFPKDVETYHFISGKQFGVQNRPEKLF